MEPLSPRQKSLILSSFKKVFATGDIENLSTSAYKYIYLASGFIAHYNLYGFRDAYRDVRSLKEDILANAQANAWRNFTPSDKDYSYYKSKAEVYSGLVSLLKAASV
jgi:hypothetical protein